MAGFGKKVGSAKKLKQSLKKGGGSGLAYVPKDGELTVRFLSEPIEWFSFNEVWDDELNRGYPQPDDPGMPGGELDPGARVSERYVAPALDVENNRVIVIQMAKSLVDNLMNYYDKYSTLLDRDYDLIRSGSGLDTKYGAAPDVPRKRNVSKLTVPDLGEALEAAYRAVFDDIDDDEEEAPKKKAAPRGAAAKKGAAASKRRIKAMEEDEDEEEEEFEDDEDEEEFEEDDEVEEDEDDEEEDDEEEDDEEEEEQWTEEELQELDIDELREVASQYGIKAGRMKKATIIKSIMEFDEF